MSKIPCNEIVSAFQGYLAAGDGYIPGASGQTWTQNAQDKSTNATVQKYGQQWVGHRVEDCSGAFVRAYKAHGMSIYHGSNRIAREYVVELLPIDQAKPGMAAFKARKPGEQYYDLPGEYKPGGKHYNGDLTDYYHIGLVDDNPEYVINAQSAQTGVVRSKLSSNWCAVGYLKAVQYDDQEDKDMADKMVVNTDKVNLRAAPDKDAARVEWLNKGDIVTLGIAYPDGWDYVTHGRKSGYVMAKFLDPVDADIKPAEPSVNQDDESIAPDENAATDWLYRALKANEEEREALTMLQQLLTGAVG